MSLTKDNYVILLEGRFLYYSSKSQLKQCRVVLYSNNKSKYSIKQLRVVINDNKKRI